MCEDVHCAGVLYIMCEGVTTEEAKRLGSADTVKRHSKNDLTRHLTPRTTRPMHHGI
jgi:hypothetical protein